VFIYTPKLSELQRSEVKQGKKRLLLTVKFSPRISQGQTNKSPRGSSSDDKS